MLDSAHMRWRASKICLWLHVVAEPAPVAKLAAASSSTAQDSRARTVHHSAAQHMMAKMQQAQRISS
jgi:hypothetical protein